MATLRNFRLLSISVLLLFALSACSDGPSNAEAQQALQERERFLAITRAGLTGDGSRVGDIEVRDVRVNNCESRDPMPGYDCELEYTLSSHSGQSPTETHIDPYTFIKFKDGWRIMK